MAELLLSVPLKTSTEIDFIDVMKRFQPSSVGTEYSSAVDELNKSRNQCVRKNISKSQYTLDILYRYHDQLAALSKKLPTDLPNISFNWEDALDRGSLFGGKSSVSSSNMVFERICVLFNIAALQSQLGTECRQADTDEEMKTAAKWYQSASGIFLQLADQNLTSIDTGGQNLTSDVNPDTLSALSALMLAQAQEMFVTKAIKDAMKDKIIAKLCVQAEDLYSDAMLKMTKDTVKHLWDRSWLPNVAGKKSGYEGLSQYFQSQVCATDKRVGEQIARLNLCQGNLRKAQERMGNPNFLTYFLNEASRIVVEAQKDNDFIYHEPIPEPANVPTIDRVMSARLAKSVAVPEMFSPNFKDLFENFSLAPTSFTPSTPTPVPEPEITKSTHPTQPSPSPSQPTTPTQENRDSVPTSPTDPSNDAPTLSEILNTSVQALGNYLQGYLIGRRPQ